MEKRTYVNPLNYLYDGTRKNAKYSLDNGEHFMNHGDYAECLAKAVLGYEAKKEANTRYDKGHDIEELKASVKSARCGLTDRTDMPKERVAFLEKFWATEPCENFIWVYDYEDMVDLWFMNRIEFQSFVANFGTWDNYSNKIRINTCSTKINTWLENQIR